MTRRIELLAPGGDVDSIKAAVAAGADAIYCGLNKFNARNRATNLEFEALYGVLRLAHQHNCRVYLTLNVIIVESDLPELMGVLNRLANTSIDGIIVQDLGLMYLLAEHYPGLPVHASTQVTTHNAGQVAFLSRLAATRMNLSRELSVQEIRDLARVGQVEEVSTEVFVHGAYCISFSGLCYLSSVQGARSGNRGRCSQPCRDRYLPTGQGVEYPLNLKDNSAFFDLKTLADAGVDAIKIEGRVKKYSYVHTVTTAWRKQLDGFYDHGELGADDSALYTVFNRDFTNGYLMGDIHRSMFSDYPRNHSAKQLDVKHGRSPGASTRRFTDASYEKIAENVATARRVIEQVHVSRAPLTLSISGALDAPLAVSVKTPEETFTVRSEVCLTPLNRTDGSQHLTRETFLDRLGALGESEYFVEQLELDHLQPDLFVPFNALTDIRRRILFLLRGSIEAVAPIAVPRLEDHRDPSIRPTLSVLLSSPGDLHLSDATRALLHYRLPACLEGVREELSEIFANDASIVPWFPPVLIGEDFRAAVDFLRQVHPKRIVTDNTGIAYEAFKQGIHWIAGPYLNTANSHALLCLKERFDCRGAFVSNELSRDQIRRIKRPEGFELIYSLYHPILLFASRQCLFHQVTGCEKHRVDASCLAQCERTAEITNLKQVSMKLRKSKGNHAAIFHEVHFLNTDIVADEPGLFTGFAIDLRDVETNTRVDIDKGRVIQLFQRLVDGDVGSIPELNEHLQPTSNATYGKGM